MHAPLRHCTYHAGEVGEKGENSQAEEAGRREAASIDAFEGKRGHILRTG